MGRGPPWPGLPRLSRRSQWHWRGWPSEDVLGQENVVSPPRRPAGGPPALCAAACRAEELTLSRREDQMWKPMESKSMMNPVE
eukprot:4874493-Prorocentrum_lima.AAC.1